MPSVARWNRPGPAAGLAGLVGALGVLGLLPAGVGGPAAIAWLALIALPAGLTCGTLGLRLPLGLAAPATWMLGFALVLGREGGANPGVWVAGLYAVGLYLAGLGVGLVRPGGMEAAFARGGAALVLLAGLAWIGLSTGVLTGAARGAGGFAAAHPEVQGRLLELSCLLPAFDAVGWDWLRESPLAYRLGGAEWVARAPWQGRVAAGATSLVGCALALLAPRLGASLSRRATDA